MQIPFSLDYSNLIYYEKYTTFITLKQARENQKLYANHIYLYVYQYITREAFIDFTPLTFCSNLTQYYQCNDQLLEHFHQSDMKSKKI